MFFLSFVYSLTSPDGIFFMRVAKLLLLYGLGAVKCVNTDA